MKVLPYACLVYGSVQLWPAPSSTNGWVSLPEGQVVDGYTRRDNHIYCGEVACGTPPMSGVDVTTFQVWPGSKYAKDKAAVYYPLRITCTDYTDCGVCACTKYRLSNVAVQAFTYLGKDYATDHTRVVFRGQALQGADGKSFRVIRGPEFFYFAVDKGHVYEHGHVFVGADPHTFYYDRYHKRTDEEANQYVVADKRHKWLFIPPTTIQVLK